jgi:FdhE protein
VACLHCGEAVFEQLAVYRADELPGTRVDACETCRHYVKTIDLTVDATAVPVVDDIATVALDLWAREQGYRRVRPNLLLFDAPPVSDA